MQRPSLAHALVLLALVGCKPAPTSAPTGPASSTAPAVPAAPVTVIFVRHGEKAQDDPRDPSLSPAGAQRAADLAALLRVAGVTHLFASEYRRTQATLRPLAAASGREVAVHPAADADALLAALRGLPPGAVAVVAGHSNTLPKLVAALGADPRGEIPDDVDDRLLIVTVPPPPARPRTLELRYGATR
jgi:phosphohistidine phosphatase SixA